MKLKLFFTTKATSTPHSLILFNPPPSPHKHQPLRRLSLLTLISFFVVAAFTRLNPIKPTTNVTSPRTGSSTTATDHFPPYLSQTLLHYATSNATKMPPENVRLVAQVLSAAGPSNLLAFGLNFESLLWRALNHGGRTVFVDESAYRVSKFEEQHPGVEAYDVQSFTAGVGEVGELLAAAREEAGSECRPVQNLLFSECPLAINDLPNELYEVEWDVVLVDGPSAPGKMAAIFTAGVMARNKKDHVKNTHVLVHGFDGIVERTLSEEFLCNKNMQMVTTSSSSSSMAHFLIQGNMKLTSSSFCSNSSTSS